MRLFNAFKIAHQELNVSQHFPITHLNTSTIFESNNSMMGSTLKLEGVPFDTETNEHLNHYKNIWHTALTGLDENFCVWMTTHRHPINVHLSGEFKSEFCKHIDEQYHQKFQSEHFYANDIYLTLIYKGLTTGKIGKGIHIFRQLSDKYVKESRTATRAAHIKKLTAAVSQLKTSLSVFSPTLLGETDTQQSALLTFLGLSVNGGQSIRYRFPRHAATLSKQFDSNDWQRYPHGHLAPHLPMYQIFFGEYIQFQGATTSDRHFAAMLSIKQYGTESTPILLDPLLHLRGSFISINTFAVEPKELALKAVSEQARRLNSVEDKARSQIHSLERLQDHIASSTVRLGRHHHSLMLLANDLPSLEKLIREAIQCYAEVGFVAVRETIGQEPIFWAQIPTNIKYIARSSLITSGNFVDFCPLHNYRTGFRDQNHLGSAVSILETPSKTPYYLNFHVPGDKQIPSKGHVIGVGGNHSGKTVFMTFADSQLSRYEGQTFYFDRDRGAEIYIRAAGGYYARLSPDAPQDTCFNPLQLPDTPSNRQFNRDLLEKLCCDEHMSSLPAEILADLTRCVDYAYDALISEHRTLSNAVKLLPIDFPRWASLKRWLRGNGTYPDGEYAYVFDNHIDKLHFHKKMGFDMTHFLDREPIYVRTPVMMYLLHRILMAMNGQLVSLFFDEGWQYFIDPYWVKTLERLLPTIRKKNGHLLLFTQSPNSIVNSPIRHVIQDNIATEIYFSNPQANPDIYMNGLHLTPSEYDFVKHHLPESRLFLLKQGHASTICKLNLSHIADYLPIFSGTEQSVRLLDQLRVELGDDPASWIQEFLKRRSML